MPLTAAQAAIEARALPWPSGTAQAPDADVAYAAYNVGARGDALVIATAIALTESGGNELARNFNRDAPDPRDNEDSRGYWQINIFAHPQYAGQQLFTPVINAAAMKEVSNGFTNWSPWTTYTSGAYRANLERAKAAASTKSIAGQTAEAGPAIPASPIPNPASIIGGAIWNGLFSNLSPGEFAVRALEVVGGGILMLGGLTLVVLTLAQAPVSSVRSGPVRGLVGRLSPTERGLRNVAGEQRRASETSARARRMEAEDRIYRSSTARRRQADDDALERRARADAPARAARNRRYRSEDAVANRRGSGSTRRVDSTGSETLF